MSNVLGTQNEIICQALNALGISTENLKEVHIHIIPDDIVKADCVYYVKDPPLFSVKKLKELKKQYNLHFKEPTKSNNGKNKSK